MTFPRPDPASPEGAADESFLDTPNCPVCLHRMQVEVTAAGVPFWSCAGCGAGRVA